MGGTSSQTMQRPVVINATAKHTATVIFLHGLGDTGHGWSSMFADIQKPHIKYVCPTAPVQPVSLNAGFAMPSWFDIKSLEAGGEEDIPGIKLASTNLQALLQEEQKHVPRNRILVGGFSQGGALAFYSSLAEKQEPLGGILGLSCWLPNGLKFKDWLQSNKQTPVLQCHGTADPLVRLEFGQMTNALLESTLDNVTFKTYNGLGHSSCDEEIQDVKEFINKVLP